MIFSSDIGVKSDLFGEMLILFGIISSSCIALGSNRTIFFICSWLCYLSLFILGQAFLMFQWDMLLLEVGFLSIFSSIFMLNGHIMKPVNWCYRFLVWKLMFMAGVVKLQSKCPTWFGLTALEVADIQ